MKAFLKNYRQSPRKVRLVASFIKGKSVEDAILHLDFLVKRASTPLKKLLLSALSNAKAQGFNEDLVVKDCVVDKGIVLKRWMPKAMGRGARINKRTSHVYVELEVKKSKDKKKVNKTKTEENIKTKKEKDNIKEKPKKEKEIKKTNNKK